MKLIEKQKYPNGLFYFFLLNQKEQLNKQNKQRKFLDRLISQYIDYYNSELDIESFPKVNVPKDVRRMELVRLILDKNLGSKQKVVCCASNFRIPIQCNVRIDISKIIIKGYDSKKTKKYLQVLKKCSKNYLIDIFASCPFMITKLPNVDKYTVVKGENLLKALQKHSASDKKSPYHYVDINYVIFDSLKNPINESIQNVLGGLCATFANSRKLHLKDAVKFLASISKIKGLINLGDSSLLDSDEHVLLIMRTLIVRPVMKMIRRFLLLESSHFDFIVNHVLKHYYSEGFWNAVLPKLLTAPRKSMNVLYSAVENNMSDAEIMKCFRLIKFDWDKRICSYGIYDRTWYSVEDALNILNPIDDPISNVKIEMFLDSFCQKVAHETLKSIARTKNLRTRIDNFKRKFHHFLLNDLPKVRVLTETCSYKQFDKCFVCRETGNGQHILRVESLDEKKFKIFRQMVRNAYSFSNCHVAKYYYPELIQDLIHKDDTPEQCEIYNLGYEGYENIIFKTLAQNSFHTPCYFVKNDRTNCDDGVYFANDEGIELCENDVFNNMQKHNSEKGLENTSKLSTDMMLFYVPPAYETCHNINKTNSLIPEDENMIIDYYLDETCELNKQKHDTVKFCESYEHSNKLFSDFEMGCSFDDDKLRYNENIKTEHYPYNDYTNQKNDFYKTDCNMIEDNCFENNIPDIFSDCYSKYDLKDNDAVLSFVEQCNSCENFNDKRTEKILEKDYKLFI